MGKTLKDLLNHSFATYAEQTAIRELKPVEGSRTSSYQPVTYAELKVAAISSRRVLRRRAWPRASAWASSPMAAASRSWFFGDRLHRGQCGSAVHPVA